MDTSLKKLMIKLLVVLAAVVLLSKVNLKDKKVLAGNYAGLLVSDAKVGTLPEGFPDFVIADEGCDANGMEKTGIEDEVPKDLQASELAANDLQPGGPDVFVDSDTGINDEPQPDINGQDSPDIFENDADSGLTPDELEADLEILPGDTADTSDGPIYADAEAEPGVPELEYAERMALEDEDYRKTREYRLALLVTSPEHYNSKIVNRARELPTDSNDLRYELLTGKGYKAYTTKDMPEGYKSDSEAKERMVTFDVPVWKMTSKGEKYSDIWSITINSELEASIRCIFSDIYQLDIQFPFNYLIGYKYRKVGGSGLINSKLMSVHSFGAAVDINFWDDDNDYYLGKGNDLRDKSNPYCIPDEVIAVFEDYGWFWGGNFDICSDTMHFQYFGLEFLQYDSDEPFPILYRGAGGMDKKYIKNLSQRLKRLGYMDYETSSFSRTLEAALKSFQEDYGLEVTGSTNYETWVPLINATHDMSYVF